MFLKKTNLIGRDYSLARLAGHCTLYTTYCTLNTARCTLNTARCTLHTARCTLHTARCTLHTALEAATAPVHFELRIDHCILHTKHVYCMLFMYWFPLPTVKSWLSWASRCWRKNYAIFFKVMKSKVCGCGLWLYYHINS